MFSPMPEVGEAIALVLTPVDLADGARGLQIEIRRIASDEAEEELLLYGQPLPSPARSTAPRHRIHRLALGGALAAVTAGLLVAGSLAGPHRSSPARSSPPSTTGASMTPSMPLGPSDDCRARVGGCATEEYRAPTPRSTPIGSSESPPLHVPLA